MRRRTKIKNGLDLNKILYSCIYGGDAYRYAMNGIFYPKQAPYAIATDGKVLFGLKITEEREPKDIFQSGKNNAWQADIIGALKEIDGQYPDFLQALPTELTIYETKIPYIISGKRSSYEEGNSGIWFDEGDWNLGKGIQVRTAPLKHFAGHDVRIGVGDSSSKPIVLFPHDAEEPYSSDWFYIIMPMLGGSSSEYKSKHIGKLSAAKLY